MEFIEVKIKAMLEEGMDGIFVIQDLVLRAGIARLMTKTVCPQIFISFALCP